MNKKYLSSMVLRTGAALFVAAGTFGFAPAPAVAPPVCSAAAVTAELLPEIDEIRDLTLCAWAALVSRDDHAGQTARYTLQAMGYDLSGLKLDTPKGNAEFNIISAADETGAVKSKILVMGGTSTLSESANLAEPAPVFFEGGNPFAEAATSTAERKIIEPKVHHGFDLRVKTFFFTPDANGQVIGRQLAEELKANPDLKLHIVGHGNSGATATILGARLLNLSVPREQLEVVTFGAPPVGNEAFGRYYLHRLPLTRVVMKSGAIVNFLKNSNEIFDQYGEKREWTPSKVISDSPHEMTSYLDSALHLFFDRAATYPAPPARPDASEIYVAPIHFNLDPRLASDQLYMDEALTNSLRQMYPGALFTNDQQETVAQSIAAAKRLGAKFVLVELVSSDLPSYSKENYPRLTLTETIYRIDGSFIFYQESSLRLKKISPIEGCLYNQISLKEAREAALASSAQSGDAVPQLTFSLSS